MKSQDFSKKFGLSVFNTDHALHAKWSVNIVKTRVHTQLHSPLKKKKKKIQVNLDHFRRRLRYLAQNPEHRLFSISEM